MSLFTEQYIMKSGFLISLFIFFLTISLIFAVEEEEDSFFIGPNIFNGPELIYNCQKGHFACVSLPSKNDCLDTQEYYKEKNRPTFGCVALKSYEMKVKCQDELRRLTHAAYFPHFCLREEMFDLFKQY